MASVLRSDEKGDLLPSERDLQALFRRHQGDPDSHGWRVRMRQRFRYYSPDEWYEAVVDRLVTPGCRWVDVGGGRSIFPENESLSRELAGRCGLLVGVDPSENIFSIPFVHERARCGIEDFHPGERFDLATFRMVAEHIARPRLVVRLLGDLVRPGGHVVIYTPNRWTPLALGAGLVPDRWHTVFTRLSDRRGEEDVFPTVYRMNTRRTLGRLFEESGFSEVAFAYLDNCRTFQRLRPAFFTELCAWRALRGVGITYPQNDLLGVYRRSSE